MMRYTVSILAIWATVALMAAFLVSPGEAQQAVPSSDPLIAACSIASGAADAAGLVVEKCRRVSQEVVGIKAVVELRVKIATIGWFNVKVWLMQSTWAQTGFTATPA